VSVSSTVSAGDAGMCSGDTDDENGRRSLGRVFIVWKVKFFLKIFDNYSVVIKY